MRLTVVGSSDAFHSGARRHASYHLAGLGDGEWMVDFGATSLLGLRKLALDPAALSTIALTHLHGDHFAGLPFLFLDAMFKSNRTAPLTVIGPPGTEARVGTLFRCLYPNLASQTPTFAVRFVELSPGGRREVDGVVVEAFAAEHMTPPDQALCLRLTRNETSYAFSGDTELCDGLYAAASGAKLLVLDCTGYETWVGRHCTWQELSGQLASFGDTALVLSHLGAEMRAKLPQPVAGTTLTYAEDGLTIDA